MGLAALLVFTAPLLVTQVAFRRYAGIRLTTCRPCGALSRMTEVADTWRAATRTGQPAGAAIGRELGMSDPTCWSWSTPRSCHDIGQLSLADSHPGRRDGLAVARDQRRIAGLGAEVMGRRAARPRRRDRAQAKRAVPGGRPEAIGAYAASS